MKKGRAYKWHTPTTGKHLGDPDFEIFEAALYKQSKSSNRATQIRYTRRW
jgi:hypothetical protein